MQAALPCLLMGRTVSDQQQASSAAASSPPDPSVLGQPSQSLPSAPRLDATAIHANNPQPHQLPASHCTSSVPSQQPQYASEAAQPSLEGCSGASGSDELAAQSASEPAQPSHDGCPGASGSDGPAAAAAAAMPGFDWMLELRGGTDASMAPPVGYLQHVVLPTLAQRFDVRAQLKLVKRGFYPRGGGHIELQGSCLAPGSCLPAMELVQRGNITGVTISAFTAGQSHMPATHGRDLMMQ